LLEARIATGLSDWTGVLEQLPSGVIALDEQAHELRARAYQAMDRPNDALEAYGAALAIHPHSPGLWLGMGEAQRMAGQPNRALASFSKALTYDPQDGRIQNNLGSLHASRGDLETAIVRFKLAIESESTPPEAYSNLSTAYRRSGFLTEAVETARRGKDLTPDAGTLNALGNAYAALGEQDNAAQAYLEGPLRKPDRVQLHFNLARSYEKQGNTDLAILRYREVLKRLGDRFASRKTSIETRIRQLERGADSTQ
jgi:tetratricopeptide (TPR) repeat protein